MNTLRSLGFVVAVVFGLAAFIVENRGNMRGELLSDAEATQVTGAACYTSSTSFFRCTGFKFMNDPGIEWGEGIRETPLCQPQAIVQLCPCAIDFACLGEYFCSSGY